MPIRLLKMRLVCAAAALVFLLGTVAAPSARAYPMDSCSPQDIQKCRDDGGTAVSNGANPPSCFCFILLPFPEDTLSVSPDSSDPIGSLPSPSPVRPVYAAPTQDPSRGDVTDKDGDDADQEDDGTPGSSAPIGAPPTASPIPLDYAAVGTTPDLSLTAGFYAVDNNYRTTAVRDAGHDWVWHVSPDNRERSLDGHFEHLEELNGERVGNGVDPTSMTDSADLQLPTLYQLEELASACAEDQCYGGGASCTSDLSLLCDEAWPDPRLGESGNCAWTRTVLPAAKPSSPERVYAVCITEDSDPNFAVLSDAFGAGTTQRAVFIQPNPAAKAWLGGGLVDSHLYGCQPPDRLMTCAQCFAPGVSNPTFADCPLYPWGIDILYTHRCRERPCVNGSASECGSFAVACF